MRLALGMLLVEGRHKIIMPCLSAKGRVGMKNVIKYTEHILCISDHIRALIHELAEPRI